MTKLSIALTAAVLFAACGSDAKHIHTLEATEFATKVEGFNLPLIDVRTAEEYAEGHLPGAVNIDVNNEAFVGQAGSLGNTIAVYCLRGSRSMKAATLLAKSGKEVYNLDGGITAWKKAELKIEH
ncbi:MAG: rhodanese-like domain-containing protein [Bacteroidales bacterium]|nr:rhodanese-like domain-containing protein [Bacteroidales bacterium]